MDPVGQNYIRYILNIGRVDWIKWFCESIKTRTQRNSLKKKIGNPTHQLLNADPSHWVEFDWWIGALLILLSCGEACSSSPVRASLSRVGENHVNFLEFLSVICSMYLEI